MLDLVHHHIGLNVVSNFHDEKLRLVYLIEIVAAWVRMLLCCIQIVTVPYQRPSHELQVCIWRNR